MASYAVAMDLIDALGADMEDRAGIGRAVIGLSRRRGIEAIDATGQHSLRVRLLDHPFAIIALFVEPASIRHDDLFGPVRDRTTGRHRSRETGQRATPSKA